MRLREKYTCEIGSIQGVIDIVKGNPCCHIVGERLNKEFNELLEKIEKDAVGSGDILAERLKNIN